MADSARGTKRTQDTPSRSRKHPSVAAEQAALTERTDSPTSETQPAIPDMEHTRPDDILALQRTVGNRYVGHLLHGQLNADGGAPRVSRASQGAPETTEAGQALDGSVRSRMESAYGTDLSGVRVHTDPTTASAAEGMDAAAFTVGQHIGFGHGEYQPGTVVGDSLIAHEVAHTIQQRGAEGATPPMRAEAESASLEADAGAATRGTVATYLGKTGAALSRLARSAAPTLRSGLRIQACSRARARRIQDILQQIPAGREALQLREQHNVKVEDSPGAGSYFNPANNTIYLDRSEDDNTAALTFIHEMNHAKYWHENRSGNRNIMTLGRQQYIDAMLEEESEGVVRAIEGRAEAQAAGAAGLAAASTPLLNEYNAAVEAARRANPEATPAELRAAGKRRVDQAFRDGTVVTSTTRQTYADYYGQGWDNAHAGGGGGGGGGT